MKKLLIAAAAMSLCAGAYAQGVIFAINSDNLIYFTTDTTHLAPGDAQTHWDSTADGGPFTIAGSSAFTGTAFDGVSAGSIQSLAGSPTFVAALYAGTSSSALSLQTTTTIDSWANFNAGGIVPVNANLPATSGFAVGTPAWFQVEIYDSRYASAPAAWAANGVYAGESPIFENTPLAIPGYIWNTASPANSTWAPGTFNVIDVNNADQLGAGSSLGGIALYANNVVVPEPGTFALAGLGLAAMLVFRRS